mgnify:CR=1 FL=1
MTTTYPIIPWMGGKRRLAKHLLPLFPEHTCYVELFAGGAALFFMRPERATAEVLNDINGELVNLYRVVQHHFDEFVRQFDWTLGSREHFSRLQATPPEIMTDIQRAPASFTCNTMLLAVNPQGKPTVPPLPAAHGAHRVSLPDCRQPKSGWAACASRTNHGNAACSAMTGRIPFFTPTRRIGRLRATAAHLSGRNTSGWRKPCAPCRAK